MKRSLSGVTAVEILASKDIVFDNLQLDALEIGSNYTITFSAYFRGQTVVFETNPITIIGKFLRPDSQDLFYYVGQTFDTLNVQMRSTDFTRAVSASINNNLFFFEDNYQSYQIAFTEGFYSIDGVNSELRLKLEDLGIAVDLFSFTKDQDKVFEPLSVRRHVPLKWMPMSGGHQGCLRGLEGYLQCKRLHRKLPGIQSRYSKQQ